MPPERLWKFHPVSVSRPIFSRHLKADYQSFLTVTGWICSSTRDWIAHHSRVDDILSHPQDDGDLMF